MHPQIVFRPNYARPARRQIGKGKIRVRSQQDGRYICHVRSHTFTATRGTAFYRRRLPMDTIVTIATLLAHSARHTWR